jgi:hypothetical protein
MLTWFLELVEQMLTSLHDQPKENDTNRRSCPVWKYFLAAILLSSEKKGIQLRGNVVCDPMVIRHMAR